MQANLFKDLVLKLNKDDARYNFLRSTVVGPFLCGKDQVEFVKTIYTGDPTPLIALAFFIERDAALG